MKRKALAFCMRYGESSCVLSKSHGPLWGPRTKGRTGPQSPSAVPERERGWRGRTPWADGDRTVTKGEREGWRGWRRWRGAERAATITVSNRPTNQSLSFITCLRFRIPTPRTASHPEGFTSHEPPQPRIIT